MQASNQPDKISLPFANSGGKQPIPVASQIGLEDGRASYTDGFPPLTRTPLAAGGKPPFGTDMNGILFDITAIQQWQSAGGLFTYDATLSAAIGGYPKGALLSKADASGYWKSTVDNNTGNPDTGGAGWVDPFSAVGTVGSAVNATMRVTTASATGAFTADQLTLSSSLGGISYARTSFNKTINLGITGVGGMDAGLAPANGFVAIYAIYNPTTGVDGLLATNATAAIQPEIYAGTSMPSGFTASALVMVWPVNSSRLLFSGVVLGREYTFASRVVRSANATQSSLTSLSVATAFSTGEPVVPRNAKYCSGYAQMESTDVTAKVGGTIASTTSAIGQQSFLGYGSTSCTFRVPLFNSQAIAYNAAAATGTPNNTIVIAAYEF